MINEHIKMTLRIVCSQENMNFNIINEIIILGTFGFTVYKQINCYIFLQKLRHEFKLIVEILQIVEPNTYNSQQCAFLIR